MTETRAPGLDAAFETLTGVDPDARDADAPRGEVGNFFRHALSLSLTKASDGLLDPKLVLAWLLTQMGAPAVFVGLLVPIREAGALLPQIVISARIMGLRRRRLAWALGSAIQGLMVLAILGAALVLRGWAFGLAVCAALAVLALARSICSVSYKDVLGRTVGKSRRGTVTGFAGSAASAAVVIFGCFLVLDWAAQETVVLWALGLAGLFWLLAAGVFATLDEPEAEPQEPQDNPFRQFALLRDHPQLTRFIVARGCLVATALAPPYLLLLAGQGAEGAFAQLGLLLFASAGAALVSSYVWGRLADYSSRRVLMLSGAVAAAILGLAAGLGAAGLMAQAWLLPVLLFGVQVAYQGVRQGRSTYLVDMAGDDQRAAFTAVSNTLVGLILLGGGIFGLLASLLGPVAVIAAFAMLSLLGVWVSSGLEEVEARAA